MHCVSVKFVVNLSMCTCAHIFSPGEPVAAHLLAHYSPPPCNTLSSAEAPPFMGLLQYDYCLPLVSPLCRFGLTKGAQFGGNNCSRKSQGTKEPSLARICSG